MFGQAPIAAAVRSYLTYCRVEKGLSAATLRAYESDFESYSRWLQESCEESFSQIAVLQRFQNHLLEQKLSSRSIARKFAALRGLLQYLVAEGQLAKDPTEFLRTPNAPRKLPKAIPQGRLAEVGADRKSTRLNSSHSTLSRMPSSA